MSAWARSSSSSVWRLSECGSCGNRAWEHDNLELYRRYEDKAGCGDAALGDSTACPHGCLFAAWREEAG